MSKTKDAIIDDLNKRERNMKRRYKCSDGKFREYEVKEYTCKKRKCFVPFEGNGQKICRLYELGRCPENPK